MAKTLRIEIVVQEDDGPTIVKTLEGEDAATWGEMVASVCMFAENHRANPDWGRLNWRKNELMEHNIKLDSILRKQRKRYELLLKIYELTDGDETKILGLETGEELDPKEIQSIIDYLAGEGLVKSLADEGALLSITHRGVVEVEQALLNPKEPTEHFPAQVIQHFHAAVGSVQTGNQNIANVTQNVSGDARLTELLQELRRQITDQSPDRQEEGIELLEGLETEVGSRSPSESRLKLYLAGPGSFVKDAGKDC